MVLPYHWPPVARPQNARPVADHPGRIPRGAGPALSAVDPRRAGRLVRSRCILAKERAGCVSLWSAEAWETEARQPHQADRAEDSRRRHRRGPHGPGAIAGPAAVAGREPVELERTGAAAVPEAFRRFLGVDRDPPDNEVMVIGAAVCVEIWKPAAWLKYLQGRMPKFRCLFHQLSS